MKKKLLYIVLFVAGLSTLSSCSSSFLKEYSQDLGRVQSVDDLKELLVGDCILPKGLFSNNAYYFQIENPNYMFVHFMSDELEENITTQAQVDGIDYRNIMFPYFTWQQNLFLNVDGKTAYSSQEDTPWTLAYEKINNCNMVLVAADELSVKSEDEAAQVQKIKGELYYLRASYYLMLVNLYGKPYTPATAATEPAVPIKTSENVEDKEFQRSSVADVYALIESDLSEAENLLKTASAPQSIYHPGIEAVYILRSRVAMYMQDWQTAADYAKKAIDKDNYLLNLAEVSKGSYPISKSNAEVVFSNGASALGNVLFNKPAYEDADPECSPCYQISDNLYSLFDNNDYRKTTYITTEDDLTNGLPTYHKVDCSVASLGVYKDVSDVFSIRTAEAYLNLAESDAELGKDQEACEWLNKLRQNRIANAENIQLSGEELMKFIREERERELFLEGHRWFDLRRYSVDEKYPFSKEIVHTMSLFKSQSGREYRATISKYRFNKNDAAFTLDIPKLEKDFQPSVGSNLRPARKPFDSQDFNAGDGDDDDDY